MDKRERYRLIVSRLIEEYASYKPSHGQIETEAIVDRAKDHYEVMHVGWDGSRRVHGSVVHIDIIDGKVWIQYDGTSPPGRGRACRRRHSAGRHRPGIPPGRGAPVHRLCR